MPTTATVAAIANAVTLVDAMALLATPIAFIIQLVWVSCSQSVNRLSHDSNLAFGKGGSGG